jgi:hypothetical protein
VLGSLILGLLSYPPFFLWGYDLAEIGGRSLPVSVIFSSLNILAWYVYILQYRRATRGVRRDRPLKLWAAALAFLFAASLGAWGRAALVALKLDDPFLSAAAVHLFLDLFSGGWALLGLLGLAYASKPDLARAQSGWEDPLLFLGLPLSFLLGVPVDLVPPDLRTLAGLGGMAIAVGLGLHVKALWPSLRRPLWSGWGLPLALLLLKAAMDAAASLAPLARWAEAMGLRILYLHVLLLGFVTLGLFAAGSDLWKPAAAARRWFVWAICLLLVSLLPLSGVWPVALSGGWALGAAFFAALGPVITGLWMLAWDAAGLRASNRGERAEKLQATPGELS